MDNTTYIALSRIDTLTRALDVTANNLANASTDGFKASKQLFTDYLVKQKDVHGTNAEKVQQFSQDKATYQDHIQGTLKQTGNPLDLAIDGEGYFTVRTQNGTRLSRNGQFHRRADGTIIDVSGHPLLDIDNKNIIIPETDKVVSVSADGAISTEAGKIANIQLLNVQNLNTLLPEGSYLMRTTTQTQSVKNKCIRQGMLEASNVNPVSETTQLISIQRDYDLVFQLIQTESTRHTNAIDKITTVENS